MGDVNFNRRDILGLKLLSIICITTQHPLYSILQDSEILSFIENDTHPRRKCPS